MKTEKTLSIIKPDAVSKNVIGGVISKLEKGGLMVIAAKMMHLSKEQAESFYEIHRERGFFKDLISFMISGPVLVMALEGENAVAKNRTIMGATNPKDAEAGTIRKEFADTIDENAVHGSDSLENATREIAFFFKASDLCPRTR